MKSLNNSQLEHIQKMFLKQEKSCNRFKVDYMNRSKGNFSDFDDEDDFEQKILQGLLGLIK